MTMTTEGIQPTGSIRVEVEIEISAPRDKVWTALINNTNDWWHKEFLITKNPKSFVLEPSIGGRLYEDNGDGTGFIWFTIQGIEPEDYIYMIGHTRPPYGGPCTSLIMLTLEDAGKDQTVLKISDTTHGRVDDNMVANLEGGWKMLFGELKTFAEKN